MVSESLFHLNVSTVSDLGDWKNSHPDAIECLKITYQVGPRDSETNLKDSNENSVTNPKNDYIVYIPVGDLIKASIDSLDLDTVGEDGSYIKYVSQTDGKVSASKQSFDNALNNTSINAPQTKVVKAAITSATTERTFTLVDASGAEIFSFKFYGPANVKKQLTNLKLVSTEYVTKTDVAGLT